MTGPTPNSPRVTGQWHRETDKKLRWRFAHFMLAPLVDDWRGLSLTRFVAIALIIILWHAIEGGHIISGNQVWFAVLAVSTAFGKASFELLLARQNFTQTSTTDVKADLSKIVSTVTEHHS